VRTSVLEIAGETTPGRFVADLTGAIRIFEQTGVGHVLAEPTVTVQSGSQGRVQSGGLLREAADNLRGHHRDLLQHGTIMEVLRKCTTIRASTSSPWLKVERTP